MYKLLYLPNATFLKDYAGKDDMSFDTKLKAKEELKRVLIILEPYKEYTKTKIIKEQFEIIKVGNV